MSVLKRLSKSKYFNTVLWIVILIIVWEIGATAVAATKRSPENVLPHLNGIIESVVSKDTINGSQTAVQMVLENAKATISRALVGFGIGTALGFVLALFMSRFKTVEKIAFPYLMIIQMIPILGMAPLIFAITQDISKSRIIIAAILTFYPALRQ